MNEIFKALESLDSIDGILSELSSLTNRPQGYPFSKITIYSTNNELHKLIKYLPLNTEVKSASELTFMSKKLDFRKAGKILGKDTNKVKDLLEAGADISSYNLPDDCIISATIFPIIKENNRRTTSCRKFLICVENDDCEDLWNVIQFRKSVKEYVTEILGLNINPVVFGDKYPKDNPDEITTGLTIKLLNCKESLYQALQKHGYREFAQLPIRLNIPSRAELYNGLNPQNIHKLPMADIEIIK